jgi:hypothetical protein
MGDPPFSKLTIETILLRLQFYMTYRAYIIIPAIVAVFWAARSRNPYIIIGYIAFLPWGILQLIATSDIPGTLSGYYAYPYFIASFWPLVGVLLDSNRNGLPQAVSLQVAFFSAIVAGSFIGVAQQPGRIDIGAAIYWPASIERQVVTDRALGEFIRSKPGLGTVLADTSIVALAPDGFTEGETITGRGIAAPNTVIYFEGGYEAEQARALAVENGLSHRYRVPDTAIRLATDRPLSASLAIGASIAPAPAAE